MGQGASKPYGLPTGHELKWKIISDYDQLLRSGYSGDDFDNKLEAARQLARDFRNSGQASIDQFLSQRTDIAPLGKLLIASALLPREREAMEYRPQNGDWLARLFGYFNHLPDRIINDNNVFIVFNYDRIVETLVCLNVREFDRMRRPARCRKNERHPSYSRIRLANGAAVDSKSSTHIGISRDTWQRQLRIRWHIVDK